MAVGDNSRLCPRGKHLKEARPSSIRGCACARTSPRRRMLWAVRAALICLPTPLAPVCPAFGLKTCRHGFQQTFAEVRLCDRELIFREVIDKTNSGSWHKRGSGKRAGPTSSWIATSFPEACPAVGSLRERQNPWRPGAGSRPVWAEQAAARVIFLYPTRATAKEGFSRLCLLGSGSRLPSPHARHSRLRPAGSLHQRTRIPVLGQHYENGAQALMPCVSGPGASSRLPWISFWAFLPICLRTHVLAASAWADSVLVIDEVHSFDRSMFSGLKRLFFKTFRVPVLCLTATLPHRTSPGAGKAVV